MQTQRMLYFCQRRSNEDYLFPEDLAIYKYLLIREDQKVYANICITEIKAIRSSIVSVIIEIIGKHIVFPSPLDKKLSKISQKRRINTTNVSTYERIAQCN